MSTGKPPLSLPPLLLFLPLLLLLLASTGPRGGVCEGARAPGGRGRGRGRSGAPPPEAGQFNGTLYGACRVRPSAGLAPDLPKVYGRVLLRQDGPGGAVQALLALRGLPADSRSPRAVHVHQYGDLSAGCDSAGGHYSPRGSPHPRHPGDLGNFVPLRGRIRERRQLGGGAGGVGGGGATLFGGTTLLGRAVVVHEGEDDLGRGGNAGSRLHGNAGRRLACCVIGISSPKLWDETVQLQLRARNRGAKSRVQKP